MNMRRAFADELFKRMKKDKSIFIVTADLGYKMWDDIQKTYKSRFINTGAAEQLMIGTCIGLSLSNKIALAYSITSFLLYRPFEFLKNYINYEKIPIKLVGSGREKDYAHDGITHWSLNENKIFDLLNNIETFYPDTEKDLDILMDDFLYNGKPSYLNLRK